ncbi:MAG: MFS transporter, partial [Alphaproteobacteria bacterium]|nr:MFS transporter [Alphaproteobacteria bacterium]
MAAPATLSKRGRIILAGLVGNTMEWYDFAVYGYFATVIGQQFFPSSDPAVSLIAAFGAFAAGFLIRPLGGLVFGRIGDLIGRKRALLLSMLAMALPTVIIGCLPTYETIGIAAPILIVLLRLIQGLSVGGE